MRGRAYHTYTDEELHLRYLNKRPIRFPKLAPSWAKGVNVGYKMISAWSETVAEKPSFRTAFIRRCYSNFDK